MIAVHKAHVCRLATLFGALWVLGGAASVAVRADPLGYYPLEEPTWAQPGADAAPTWSADGEEILFQRTREEGIAQIWAVAPDGTGLRRATDGTYAAGHPDACAVACGETSSRRRSTSWAGTLAAIPRLRTPGTVSERLSTGPASGKPRAPPIGECWLAIRRQRTRVASSRDSKRVGSIPLRSLVRGFPADALMDRVEELDRPLAE
jgi:hypothetical protein